VESMKLKVVRFNPTSCGQTLQVYGILEWAKEEPLHALWFANTLGRCGYVLTYHSMDKDITADVEIETTKAHGEVSGSVKAYELIHRLASL